MTKDDVLRKIEALLSKTVERGATEHEAIAAANLAQKLIAKYHIEELTTSEAQDSVGEDELPAQRKWIQYLAHAVCQNMSCQLIVSSLNRRTFINVIGRDADRKAAIDTFKMLLAICHQGIKREKARAKAQFGEIAGVEVAYASGFINAVRDEMAKQAQALMLVVPDSGFDHIRQNYPNLKHEYARSNINYRNRDNVELAQAAGYSDAKSALSPKLLS